MGKLGTEFTPITTPAGSRLLTLIDEATGLRYKISITDFFALVDVGPTFEGFTTLKRETNNPLSIQGAGVGHTGTITAWQRETAEGVFGSMGVINFDTLEFRIQSSPNYDLILRSHGSNEALRADSTQRITLPNLSGTGTEDVHANATGRLTRITSDENTKKDIEPLKEGLAFVLNMAKSTIEFKYKDESLNAEGYNYWGFGARAAVEAAGKQPTFRFNQEYKSCHNKAGEYIGHEPKGEKVYGYDSKQLLAPLYNAIAELSAKIDALESK